MSDLPPSLRSRRSVRIAGTIVGVLLFAAAVTAIATRGEDLSAAWDAIRSAPPWAFLLLGLTIAITPVVTAANFYILTRRYGAVRPGEMTALILAAWLLNYLPLWPGMVSRLAYHKAVNGIQVTDSARVIIQAGILTAIASALMAGLLLGVAEPMGLTGWSAAAIGASGGLAAALVAVHLFRSGSHPHAWRYFAVLSVRTIELGMWASRYALAVFIVGGSVSPAGALTMAALVQLALLAPLAPNGIGVREWAVGLSASVFAVGVTAEVGLTAGVLDRGVEVLVAVPMGLVAAGVLANNRRRAANIKAASADADGA